MATLAPTTGILMTAMQSGMSHIDAAAEFVDNSFGPAAGNADKIYIIDAKDAVIFMDQGNGVSDLNLLYRLGDGNSRNSGDDIGRFGVGSKFGALAFGTNVTVHTVREGNYYTFNVDWAKVLQTGKWPNAYKAEPKAIRTAPKAIRNGGTLIIVQDIHKGRARPIKNTYIKELGLRFQIALLDGKDIVYARATSLRQFLEGNLKEEISLSEAFESHLESSLSDKGEAELSFADKKFNSTMLFGKLRDGDRKLAGLHIAYGGRTIETIDKLVDADGDEVALPGKFFGRVILGNAWKKNLNYNKTRITDDREMLLAAAYEAAKELITKLSNDEHSEVVEKLSAQLSNMISPDLGQKLTKGLEDNFLSPDDGEGDEAPGEGQGDGTVEPDDSDHIPENGDPEKSAKEGNSHQGKGGLFKINLKPVEDGIDGKSAVAELIRHPRMIECQVRINIDKPLMKKTMLNNPSNRPATMLVCLNALSDYMVKNPVWIDQMFDPDTSSDIQQESQLDQHSIIYDELISKVVDEKEAK